jgi:succinate dehydrogenase/fumarate reductase flavoprotein subunit
LDLQTSEKGCSPPEIADFWGRCHDSASITGRYAGRKAANHSRQAREPEIDPEQVRKEKSTAYTPIGNKGGIGWKELNYAIMKILQDYCGACKNEQTLTAGLRLFRELSENEAASAYAANPHELGRLLEC